MVIYGLCDSHPFCDASVCAIGMRPARRVLLHPARRTHDDSHAPGQGYVMVLAWDPATGRYATFGGGKSAFV